jgi:hypothetical protein
MAVATLLASLLLASQAGGPAIPDETTAETRTGELGRAVASTLYPWVRP